MVKGSAEKEKYRMARDRPIKGFNSLEDQNTFSKEVTL